MRSLVTGGAGFIGSHVAERLLAAGHFVVVLDDLSGGSLANLPEGVEFEEGSILDVTKVDQLFEKYKFDYVYHLAAYAAENLSHFIKKFNYENNLIGSVNLINASVNTNVKHFVFTSSAAVYGHSDTGCKEIEYPTPCDSYGISKLAVEEELRVSHEMFGLNYTIFRPHNVYGPRQNVGDKYRNVVGIFMNCLRQDKPMTIFGDGGQTRCFSYIDDVAPYIVKSPVIEAARNEIFNIGHPYSTTITGLAAMVASVMGKTCIVTHLTGRAEASEVAVSHGKFKQVFQPSDSLALKPGLEAMFDWLKSAEVRESPLMPVEITKNLPESWRVAK